MTFFVHAKYLSFDSIVITKLSWLYKSKVFLKKNLEKSKNYIKLLYNNNINIKKKKFLIYFFNHINKIF